MVNYVWALLQGYVLGAIPTSVLISKLCFHDDIRRHGSGNPGTSNMTRTYGYKYGFCVLIGDMLKGFLGAWIGSLLLGPNGLYYGGLAAVLGHNWPVFLKFKGGKGVATTMGVMMAILPWWTLLACALFALILFTTRYFSLSSLVSILFLWVVTLISYASNTTLFLFVTLLTLLIFIRHRSNIDRLLSGTENKLGR